MTRRPHDSPASNTTSTPAVVASASGVVIVAVAAIALLSRSVDAGSPPAGPALDAAVQAPPPAELTWRVDPFWPRPLPNRWTVGQVSGVDVAPDGTIWIVHRPGSITTQEAAAAQDPPIGDCCIPAPPVLQFDAEGNLLSSFGGPGPGYDWPSSEHTLHVDPDYNIWIGSNGGDGNMVLKFTREGEFLMQIGEAGEHGGSSDPTTLGGPAGIHVVPDDDEVYLADGYVNRRVIVFDATTGEYKRHWGAYGEPPVDGPRERYDPDAAEPSRNFGSPVHAVRVSHDDRVYVADRSNNRIQVFEKDGTFITEKVLDPETRSMGSVWDIDFSPDPEQTYITIPDGSNHKIRIVRRSDLEEVTEWGEGGKWAGQFGWVHNAAVDGDFNIYASEVETGKRVQKFVFTGGMD